MRADTAGRSAGRARAFAATVAVAVVVAAVLAAVIGGPVIGGPVIGGVGSEGSSGAFVRPGCGYSATLVPRCGRWWGMAPLARTSVPLAAAVQQEERAIGRPLDIVHVYHRDGELFPTPVERRLARQPGRNRLLLVNWKPATDLTWRAVADGAADARIDRLARYLRATWRLPFFLSIWHEPENDVIPTAGSGMTASDYAAMFRHVVLRLRADGVTWAVTVMDYIGFDRWARQSWFADLWPGNDVVDWIGFDPYGTGAPTGSAAHDFTTLVNRPDGGFPGYYTWATTTHPGKPIMLAEWGVAAAPDNPSGQAEFFRTVAGSLASFPAIKALVYFDMPTPPPGQPRTYLRADPATIAAYRALGRNPQIVAPAVRYG